MNAHNQTLILLSRLKKLKRHFIALTDYHSLINDILVHKNIYKPDVFNALSIQEKAFLDAYLKRFSSMQDFLGAKIFPLLLDTAGITNNSMSETISLIEKEGIIDSLSNWIEIRQARNALEHDYPEKINDALSNLKFCIDSFHSLENYYHKTLKFALQYTNETI
jgi:hypothetical protein